MKNKISQALANLGFAFSEAATTSVPRSEYAKLLAQAADDSFFKNPWFTRENVMICYSSWAEALTEDKIVEFTSRYNVGQPNKASKTVGIIAARAFQLLYTIFFYFTQYESRMLILCLNSIRH